MPSPMNYIWEKSFSALNTLAVLDLPLPDRLIAAWTHNLTLLGNKQFPPDLRARYDTIRSKATAKIQYEASIRVMDELALSKFAQEVFEFCHAVVSHKDAPV